MSLATTVAVEARLLKRAAVVHAERRSGNGTVEDVAEFLCKSVRTVLNWKKAGIISHSQIGGSIWFSTNNVAEFAAKYHRSGKFSTDAPGDVKERARKEWREFLGVMNAVETLNAEALARGQATLNAEFERRLARLEVLADGQGEDKLPRRLSGELQTRRAA